MVVDDVTCTRFISKNHQLMFARPFVVDLSRLLKEACMNRLTHV